MYFDILYLLSATTVSPLFAKLIISFLTISVTIKGSTSNGQGTFEVSSGNKGIIKIYDEKGNAEDFWEFEMSSDNNKMTTKAMSSSSSIDWIRQ